MTGMTSRAVASLVRDEADSTAGVGYLVRQAGRDERLAGRAPRCRSDLDGHAFLTRLRGAARLRQLPGSRLRLVTTVHLNDPDLVEDLIERLRGSGCIVARIGPHTVAVRSGWPLEEDAAQYELDGFLRAFEALHPGARATRS
jgi:hypothetical protein